MMIDTHCHLNLPPLYDHWLEVLNRAEAAGVRQVIVPGTNIETSRIAVEISQEDDRVLAAVGIHPEELEKKNYDLGFMIQELMSLAQKNRVVAIGECGLDYFHNDKNKDLQKKLFEAQVKLAQELKLPLMIHTREKAAMLDAVEILQQAKPTNILFHCFSGDLNFWRLIEPLGAYIGVGATITYPKNDKLRETIKQIPIDRIVMETDAPWLPPQTSRGQINEPKNVTISAGKLAEIMPIQLNKVMEITGNNAINLFPQLES